MSDRGETKTRSGAKQIQIKEVKKKKFAPYLKLKRSDSPTERVGAAHTPQGHVRGHADVVTPPSPTHSPSLPL